MASKLISRKNLLPPLILYRQILRTHRLLPLSLRSLGDDYAKAEFRRHKDITNPIQIVGFLQQWQIYLDELKIQTNSIKSQSENITYGKKMDLDTLDKFNEQQIGQLYELKNEIKTIEKSKDTRVENLVEKKFTKTEYTRRDRL